MDRGNTERPQRRTALVAKDISHYNTDIAALRKTWLVGEGSLTESASGYAFSWKGQMENQDRIYGVGLAIKTGLVRKFPHLLVGINERMMKLCLPPSQKQHATVISAYVPTMTNTEEDH